MLMAFADVDLYNIGLYWLLDEDVECKYTPPSRLGRKANSTSLEFAELLGNEKSKSRASVFNLGPWRSYDGLGFCAF
jgi:hypothetical protein